MSHIEHAGASHPEHGAVLTKAVVRAAERLKVPSKVLATALGLSEPTVSRMRRGSFALAPTSKPFELGVLLVRLFRSLDAIAGGDDSAAAAWLVNANTALDGRPIDKIQKVDGLVDVIAYLDARRARV
ncbi:MAG: MbcA/ParS/Xre antitoxin family protein [Ancalomicrobiaceae bacterium]|nr:MbcA/ParS/Xre antitoxin family protein [Ancalomicrobiaceae bacterium]